MSIFPRDTPVPPHVTPPNVPPPHVTRPRSPRDALLLHVDLLGPVRHPHLHGREGRLGPRTQPMG
eukprot:425351-Prymnesium_polylepis.1